MQQTRLRFRLACVAFRSEHRDAGGIGQEAGNTLLRLHFIISMDCAGRLELSPNKSCIGWLRSIYTILTACISQVECIPVTCFPLFLSGAVMKNLPTAPQYSALPVCAWLDDILLPGGLDVEDKQNARIIRYIVLFVGLRRRESVPIKIKNTCLAVTFASLFPLTFFWCVASGLQK